MRVITDVQSYIAEEPAVSLKIQTQASAYDTALEAEKLQLDKVRKNTYTQRVNDADDDRDRPIRGFFTVVKGSLHHFDAETAQAAYNLNLICENFSDITRLSKEKQTAAQEKFTTALRAAMAHLTKTGLTGWLTEIERTNNVYLDLVKNRNAETDTLPDGNMKEARHTTDMAYDAIVDRLNAYITIEGDAAFAGFVTKVNNRIDQYSTAIAMRKGRKKTADATPESK